MKPISTATLFSLSFCTLFALHACSNDSDNSAAIVQAPSAAPAPTSQATALADPALAATATYQDLSGHPVEIADFAGKKVFVNYWATWCAPCIKEIPSIARAAAELEDENFHFLLASDESVEVINDFLLDRSFNGNFIKLNKFVGALGIYVMPTSVLYDETGTPVRSWEGSFEWDSAEMLAQLRDPNAP